MSGEAITKKMRYLPSRMTLVILGVALLQGVIYLLLLPPWQHYDEPSHFEYARLYADLQRRPTENDVDFELRRTIIASMMEHNFYHNLPPPNLTAKEVVIGHAQFDHPPGYYALTSIPLRFAGHLPVTDQLYLMRIVSLLFYLGTVAITIGMMRELTPLGHPLRWGVSLALVLLPAVADVMTAAHSDSGAVFVATLLLWGVVRLVMRGPSLLNVLWLLGASFVAVMTKNTVTLLVPLVPFAILVAYWKYSRRPWRTLALLGMTVIVVGLVAVLDWGDAAAWYRWRGAAVQDGATRIYSPDAPVGDYVLTLHAMPGIQERRIVHPILEGHVHRIAGEPVTIGAWVWANRPTTIPVIGVAATNRIGLADSVDGPPFTLSTTPTFFAWNVTLPTTTRAVHFVATIAPPPTEKEALVVYIDGAVMAQGNFPTDIAPIFLDTNATTGTWDDVPFTNLVRNASAETAGPRVRVWVEKMLNGMVSIGWGRTPSQLVAALWDVQRTIPILRNYTGFLPIDGYVSGFAWGHVHVLAEWQWVVPIFRVLVGATIIGSIAWLAMKHSSRHVPLFFLFGLGIMIMWLNTGMRVLPQISEGFAYPVARYTFSSIFPATLLLVGGWWALWPKLWRPYAVATLLTILACLNFLAIVSIWSYYHALTS